MEVRSLAHRASENLSRRFSDPVRKDTVSQRFRIARKNRVSRQFSYNHQKNPKKINSNFPGVLLKNRQEKPWKKRWFFLRFIRSCWGKLKKKCDFADGFFKNHRDKKTTGFPDGFEEIVEKDNKSKHKKAYFFCYFSQYRPEY